MDEKKQGNFFTIAIPTYNSSFYIKQCLEGILSQTFTDFNVNIIDDCSTDNTLELIRDFLPEFDAKGIDVFIKKNNPNMGGYANFNECIKIATGRYLFINHADDMMKPQMLEYIYKAVKQQDEFSMITVNSNEILKNGEIKYVPAFTFSKSDKIFYEQEGHPFLKIFLKYLGWEVSQSIYNVNFLRSNNIQFMHYLDKHDSGQDYLFFIDIVEKANKLFFLQKPLMYRRRSSDQWSKKSMACSDKYFFSLADETLIPLAKKILKMNCNFKKNKFIRHLFFSKILSFYKYDVKKRLEILKKYQNTELLRIRFPYITNLYLTLYWKCGFQKRRCKRVFNRIFVR